MASRNKLRLRSSSWGTLALLVIIVFVTAFSAAAQSTSPAALPATAAGIPLPSSSGHDEVVPISATQPAAALPPSSSSSSATASKKFPLPSEGGGGPYLPAAEVASALPVPTPEEFPSAAGLGFGGHGDECCGGGGYGWFGGPGGFGPGTYGYNGPLYFGRAAPPLAGSVLLPLVVACVSAAMYYV